MVKEEEGRRGRVIERGQKRKKNPVVPRGTWRSRISIIAGIKAGASFLGPPRSAFFPSWSPSTPSLPTYLPRSLLLKVLFSEHIIGTNARAGLKPRQLLPRFLMDVRTSLSVIPQSSLCFLFTKISARHKNLILWILVIYQ